MEISRGCELWIKIKLRAGSGVACGLCGVVIGQLSLIIPIAYTELSILLIYQHSFKP